MRGKLFCNGIIFTIFTSVTGAMLFETQETQEMPELLPSPSLLVGVYNDSLKHTQNVENAISVPRNDTDINSRNPQEDLKSFWQDLRLFVGEKDFDFGDFETHIEEYQNDLADIAFYIENDDTRIHPLGEELKFAGLMFLEMVESTHSLKRYSRSKQPGHDLVCRAIVLKVRTLVMYNWHGVLDIQIKGYEENLHILFYEFLELVQEYWILPASSLCVRAFEKHALQMKKTFEDLVSQTSYGLNRY
ncbi:hypothetical protein JCM33374_g5582 [Metschnikowia sp. JCM 33374]|nr:hypothetical protein JCM33374_g5582 [Metschnikowia sp. JCM 33374]